MTTAQSPCAYLSRAAHALALAAALLAHVSVQSADAAGRERQGGGFLPALRAHLDGIRARGLVSASAADEIRAEFQGYADRFPRVYDGPGFEHAIPAVRPLTAPYGPLIPPDLESTRPRPIAEILGRQAVAEGDVDELFRLMFAAKKEDGPYFDMFMQEPLAAGIEGNEFRKPDGTVDKEGVAAAIGRSRAAYAEWHRRIPAMAADGSLKRVAGAFSGAIAYAQKRGLMLRPAQVREGFAHVASCLSAKPGGGLAAKSESCGFMMVWMGERKHADAALVQHYFSDDGKPRAERLMARWDAGYAEEAYGPLGTDLPAQANDAEWRDHFRLYAGTAQARQALLSSQEMAEVLELERAVGRVAKPLRSLAEGTAYEGRKATPGDVRAALAEMRKIRAAFEPHASPATKARFEYAETMKGAGQVAARAKAAGIE